MQKSAKMNCNAALLFALRVDITVSLRLRLRTPLMHILSCISTISGILIKHTERGRETTHLTRA